MKTPTPSVRAIAAAACLAVCAFATTQAAAQSSGAVDKIVAAKKLRCGVQLDFPPAGFRTPQNEPEGFDVAYCKDMAKALGVTAEVVETPSAERIPALVSNRIDVLIASTSITPQRAMTVSFSQPYISFVNVVLTRKDSGIEKFADLKGRVVGGVTGTTTEQELKAQLDQWKDSKGKYTGYGNESDAYLALSQKKIDGVIVASTTAGALIKSGQFPTLAIKGTAPTPPDLAGIAVRKGDTDLQRWVSVFVWNQVRTGRYADLYKTYFGDSKAPSLAVDGVAY